MDVAWFDLSHAHKVEKGDGHVQTWWGKHHWLTESFFSGYETFSVWTISISSSTKHNFPEGKIRNMVCFVWAVLIWVFINWLGKSQPEFWNKKLW